MLYTGASLNEPPPPNYNNWPSIFWWPFLVVTIQPSYICTRPENNTRPSAYVSPPPPTGGTGGLSTGSGCIHDCPFIP